MRVKADIGESSIARPAGALFGPPRGGFRRSLSLGRALPDPLGFPPYGLRVDLEPEFRGPILSIVPPSFGQTAVKSGAGTWSAWRGFAGRALCPDIGLIRGAPNAFHAEAEANRRSA
jgi:hypothetical protein